MTALLSAAIGGREPFAVDAAFTAVYDELRRVAQRQLHSERRAITLQPTALVHETYLRLVSQEGATFENRAHFFAVAAQMMRRILVDHARARAADKRGGGVETVALEGLDVAIAPHADVISIDRALELLEKRSKRQARIVEMRFFAGMTLEETAAALDVSSMTVKREWRLARAWLVDHLGAR